MSEADPGSLKGQGVFLLPLFGLSGSAERTAFFKAVGEGRRDFAAIAITGSPAGRMSQLSWPCGVCRQVMMEFCDPEEFYVIVAVSEEVYQVRRLKELLPEGFGPANLQKGHSGKE